MPKALPVKYGDGRQIGDLAAQMRELTLDCTQSLQALLKQDEDLKLKLATIKLILDYGWGRPRQMAAPETPDRTTISLDGQLEKILHSLMERHADDDDNLDRNDEGERLLAGPDGGSLEPDSPRQPEDAEG